MSEPRLLKLKTLKRSFDAWMAGAPDSRTFSSPRCIAKWSGELPWDLRCPVSPSQLLRSRACELRRSQGPVRRKLEAVACLPSHFSTRKGLHDTGRMEDLGARTPAPIQSVRSRTDHQESRNIRV